MHSSILHAQQVVLGLEKFSVRHIVISPGSRNAPLTLGLNHNPFFKCYSIVDERCAAHVALGMAQRLREPVAVLCTSGSALLNYYPAVAEAYYSEIPLIVLSADRPPHKVDIGDGQTIRQKNVYQDHILHEATLEMIDSLSGEQELEKNQRIISESIKICREEQGPVHINIPFEEPLYNLVNQAQVRISIPDYKPDQSNQDFSELNEAWSIANRKLVLISTADPDDITEEQIDTLIKDSSVLVMTEVSGNLVHEQVVWGIDSLIAPIEQNEKMLEKWRPELVLSIGGMIVSKKIKQQLRAIDGLKHFHLGPWRATDTFFCLKNSYKVHPSVWIDQLPEPKIESNYQSLWLQHFKSCMQKKMDYLEQIPWSDFKVFSQLFKSLPDNIVLQLGNSSTIRYAQLFKMNASHDIYCNRGTSGIDGSTSTAAGSAMVADRQVIFVTGDVSFFYDSNALWNNYLPNDFKIILINNSGGGIFRILPGHQDTEVFDTYFETQHQLTAVHLSKMFGFGYREVGEESAFAKALQEFLLDNTAPQILEIFTPGALNDRILLDYFKFLK
ncbi:2-succinyl-5-enolpyruvyl-6-hydroxy-3-cyclohexene-1-carboxylic-acid synthase [Nonlabens spongiae]|uniref:2-succinyl-5-enolpyruvyl-6-hydroxy-3-cyclohexene-1-carboxylate synthase n=1 Tax=Nonlabens spongiae TaxID=331648 RepID=A0A1W6MIL3_9FLAO|nr:2-succinyl-5-enolpyruvyl-6-hydroxy-3-cyclohexene-1-carboxylic-acid synthase [Nonlabens spongiae]ARN77441.1 2-succinyl-5-enolpyruvyl-6-hydroxy-3-cyclohexene-1-carboxylic-acid synthase [Nonlabens spongiae]